MRRPAPVIAALDGLRAAINVLEHPFYERWSAGALRADELRLYAREYHRAVIALATASARAADSAAPGHAEMLRAHAAEEHEHIALWEQFAKCTGAPLAVSGDYCAETRDCAHAWEAGDHELEHLAVLYAIEAGQPEVSQTKLDGLLAHYGYNAEGPAVEYFRVHADRDRDHARQARELIERGLAEEDDAAGLAARMRSRAGAALRGNWSLLDGVEARAAA